MLHFLLRRSWNGLLVVAGVAVFVFVLFSVLPADPARMMLGQQADSASIAIVNRDLGRDLPFTRQFMVFINDLSPLSLHSLAPESRYRADTQRYGTVVHLLRAGQVELVLKMPYLRKSYQNKQLVSAMLLDKLPETAVLAFSSILLATILGIALGLLAALRKDQWPDRLALAFSVAGVSLPSFFAAILFAWWLGYAWSGWTGLEMTGSLHELDPFTGEYIAWKNLLLPALVLGMRPMAIITQLTRSSLLEVLSMDYIRTARAKGLVARTVLLRHALRNALNPIVTAISGWLGSLLAGAVFVEYIFGWNGIGKMTVQALEQYDLPLVMGIVLFISVIFVLLNLLADLINAWLDPRIRVGG
jgi:peptide/nickel transport system permease protein